jgi:hypothetical protein
MNRNEAIPARLTIASSRAADRLSRVRTRVNGSLREAGSTGNPALLGTSHDSSRDIPLDGGRAAIKNEKEGMKYIRFPQ